MIKNFYKENEKGHCIVRKVPKGWNDLPMNKRDYCQKCSHPAIAFKKCIYCGAKVKPKKFEGFGLPYEENK